MTNLAKPEYYFGNEKYLKLFGSIDYVWDIIPKIKDIIAKATDDMIIGENTVIEEDVYIKKPAIIGNNCKIRSGSYIRENVIIGNNCVIRSEIKNSVIMDGSNAAHLSYIGDSIIGIGCNLGSCTSLTNLRLDKSNIKININGDIFHTILKKFGCIIGDNTYLGSHVITNPGTLIGKNNRVYPCSVLRGFYKSNQLIKTKPTMVEEAII